MRYYLESSFSKSEPDFDSLPAENVLDVLDRDRHSVTEYAAWIKIATAISNTILQKESLLELIFKFTGKFNTLRLISLQKEV